MNVKKLAPVAKAVAAFLAAGLGVLATAAADGSITPAEWCGVVATALGATGIVYRVPNGGGE